MPSNKEIAWSWFEALNERRIDQAMAMLDDGGTWWNVGPRTAVPMPTFKKSAAEIMHMMPMRFTLHDAIAEGDKVLLEVESISPKPDGGTYNNRYCYVFVVVDRRIREVREYPDTKYSAEMLPAEAWTHEKASWEKHHGSYWFSDVESSGTRTMALRLEDMELIKQVTYRYFRFVDTANFAGVESCFTEDASVAFIGGSYRFERQGRSAILEALRSIMHEGVASLHTAHHPEIRTTGETTAEGTWYLTDWAINLQNKVITYGACQTEHRYRKTDGEWKIQHYGYTRIYEHLDELSRLPQITAHALADRCRTAAAKGHS